MILFGLTGGIACGKSTVTKTFRANGIPVVDADEGARQVVEPGTIGHAMLQSYYGKEYFLPDNTLNRAKLGALVFHDEMAMKVLNAFMGPLIDQWVESQINFFSKNYSIIGYDAALIIEKGNADKYKPLIVVSCPLEIQIERLIKRNNLTREQAQARIDAQMPVEEKIKLADFVIDTSGTIENSVNQTLEIISKLKAML